MRAPADRNVGMRPAQRRLVHPLRDAGHWCSQGEGVLSPWVTFTDKRSHISERRSSICRSPHGIRTAAMTREREYQWRIAGQFEK